LTEVLDILKPDTRLIVEIKDGYDFPEIIDAVVATITRRALEGRIGISAFEGGILTKVKRLNPEIKTSILAKYHPEGAPQAQKSDGREVPVYSRIEDLISDAFQYGVNIICPPAAAITPAIVRKIHEAGFPVRAWGLKKTADPAEMSRLIRNGVDGMTTNYPDLLAAIREKTQPQNGAAPDC
jgi:glycerophosphoryl diester phosphodiesterase